jgi:uncharacterized protein (TIGR02285 family)
MKLYSFLIVFLFISTDARGAKLDWFGYALPPYFLENNSAQSGQGIGENMYEHWRDILPEHSHKLFKANIPRVIKILTTKTENTCVVGTFLLESMKEHYVWSKPAYFEAPPSIIMTEKTWMKIGSPKKSQVLKLIEDKRLVLGRMKDRKYTDFIDNVIANHKKNKNVFEIANLNAIETSLKMLNAERIHWLIAFDTEISWASKKIETQPIVALSLDEHFDKRPVHVGCSKGELGSSIISKVDKFLSLKKNRDKIYAGYERWLIGNRSIEVFRSINK